LTTYIIDYPHGGMGCTLMAHILYSCGKINTDIKTIFSDTGDCHNYYHANLDSFKHLNIGADHYSYGVSKQVANEYSRDDTDTVCLVQLEPNDIYHLLRLKMEYGKAYKDTPKVDNFNKFFDITYEQSSIDFLESLTLKYYSMVTSIVEKYPTSVWFPLEALIKHDVKDVKSIIETTMGWTWDDQKSLEFHNYMLEANKKYLDWFENIKAICEGCIAQEVFDLGELEFWEKAAVIAYTCANLELNPTELRWYDNNFLQGNNQSLVADLKRM